MKCLNCKFEIPNDTSVCGHCGHPTAEQHKHRNKFWLSVVIVAVPLIGIAVALDLNFGDHPLLYGLTPWIPIAVVFKVVFKGEFNKTGLI